MRGLGQGSIEGPDGLREPVGRAESGSRAQPAQGAPRRGLHAGLLELLGLGVGIGPCRFVAGVR